MSPAATPVRTTSSPSILSQINEAKSQINRTQQLLLVTAGILIATVGIGVTVIHLPWQEKRQSLASRYSEEKERSELLRAIQRQKAELQDLEGKFLLQGGATVLAGQISKLATQSGLQIDSVTPQPEVVVEPYTRFQIEILAIGNLANVLRFLRAIEEHRPLLWVEQLDMGESPMETVSSFMTEDEKATAKMKDRQKVRFQIGAVTRQRAG